MDGLQSLAGKLAGKRVFVRADLNVPLSDSNHEAGSIRDLTRIRESLPTLQFLLKEGARVILSSHLGRPKGQVVESLRLKPVAVALQNLLPEYSIKAATEVVSDAVTEQVNALKPGELLLLENLRFDPREEKNDPSLSQALAALADVYVNDAFGTAHRAHCSTEGIAHFVEIKVPGFLMQKEIEALSAVLHHPERPLTAIIGGSKVSSKITVLSHLLSVVDTLVIGGAMIFTFLKAQGLSVGTSLVEPEYEGTARELLEQARSLGKTILLAEDVVVADAFSKEAAHKVVASTEIPEGWMGLDIGPKTIAAIQQVIEHARMVVWNGPLGVFEFPAFEAGTREIAETLAQWTETKHGKSILGGGDTLAALEQFQLPGTRFTHVSTGGGASLEFLEGKTLPGVAILESHPARA